MTTKRQAERESNERRKHNDDTQTGTHEQWLKARLELLKAEKELTRRSDQLAGKRQEPWMFLTATATAGL